MLLVRGLLLDRPVRGLSALVACALIGSVFVPAASAASPVVLRVMEFNIEYGGEVVDFDSIVRGARAADPDVIAVEEGFGNVPRLAEALDYPYYDVRQQVISRLPLINAPGGSGLYLFVLVAPGEVVALSNVHLPAGPYSPNLVRRGAKRSTILEIERRVRVPAVEPSVTALTSLVDQGIPALLLGDFNTPSRLDWTPETVGLRDQIHYPVNWPTSRFVEESGFVDSYRVAHPDPVVDQGLTWPSGRPRPPGEWSPGPNAPADRIDFIYTAGAIETLGSDVVGESGGPDVTIAVDPWGTDHRAIVSELLGGGRRAAHARLGRLATHRVGDRPDADVPWTRRTRSASWCSGSAIRRIRWPTSWCPESSTGRWTSRPMVGRRARTSCISRRSAVLSRTRFWVEAVGDEPHVSAERRIYGVGDPIHVRWWNAPGNRWDWVGVYERGADPNVASYLTWFYTRSTIRGRGTLDAASSGPWPLPSGRYSIYLLADDGYDILARTGFVVR